MAPLKHFARLLLGIGLVLLGIVGLILPVMPGWIFLIPGLLILADYFPPVRRLVDYIKARFHDAESAYQKNKASRATPADATFSLDPITPSPDPEQQAEPTRPPHIPPQ